MTGATITVSTTAELQGALKSPAGGHTICLKPGAMFDEIRIVKRQFENDVIIIARGALVNGLTIDQSSRIQWSGGTLQAPKGFAPGPSGYAARVTRSADIRLIHTAHTHAVRGLVVGDSVNCRFVGGNYFSLQAEGINLANCRRVQVLNNSIRDFDPIPTSCTIGTDVIHGLSRRDCEAQGGSWQDGQHPDGIQMWGANEYITIEDNDVRGRMQGIGHHGNDAIDRPKNIVIRYNRITIDHAMAIRLHDATDSIVRDNVLSRLPGSTRRLQISVDRSTGDFGGNINADAPAGHPTVQP